MKTPEIRVKSAMSWIRNATLCRAGNERPVACLLHSVNSLADCGLTANTYSDVATKIFFCEIQSLPVMFKCRSISTISANTKGEVCY